MVFKEKQKSGSSNKKSLRGVVLVNGGYKIMVLHNNNKFSKKDRIFVCEPNIKKLSEACGLIRVKKNLIKRGFFSKEFRGCL